MQLKNSLFYIAVSIIAIVLLVFALSSSQRSDAIMANVESQKTAISFQKPVKIKALKVSEGQKVHTGQILLEVERPDLLLDRDKLENEKQRELSKKQKVLTDYQSKIKLLDIEIGGKIERLQSEVEQLEAELDYESNAYSDILTLAGVDSAATLPENKEKAIQIASLNNEIKRLKEYLDSEKSRDKLLLDEDLKSIDLQLDIINKELKNLELEESTLIRRAPFDGTIGNVNSQLLELVPPYETIISLFEERPSMIKAHLNYESPYEVTVGQPVRVESTGRPYFTEGEIVEIGARIVSYRDPALPVNAPDMQGREIFVKIPSDNDFLYGEQVFVFVKSK